MSSEDRLLGARLAGNRRHAVTTWLWPLGIVLGLGVSASAAVLDIPFLARTLLAAPFYYLLPLGVGLLVVRWFENGLSRSQLLFSAYFIGLVLICALLVSRERTFKSDIPIDWIAGLILVACLVGFALSRRVFKWDLGAQHAAADFGIVLPVFGISYILHFVVFSEYPVTDLFQSTHLMKAALEFGRFDMLNPFTADSYVPVLPATEGLLIRYLGYEPLSGMWVLSALSAVPKFLVLRMVAYQALDSRASRLFAVAAGACFMSPLMPTNGDLVMLGALVLLSIILLSGKYGSAQWQPVNAVAGLVALAVGYFAARLAPQGYVVVLIIACGLPLVMSGRRLLAGTLCLFPLIVAMVPVHRSSLAFVPLSLVCGAALAIVRQGAVRWRITDRMLLSFVGGSALLIGVGVIGLLIYTHLNPADDLRELFISRWISETALGGNISDNLDVLPGSGPKVALFELGRAMSPGFFLFTVVLVAIAWTSSRHRMEGGGIENERTLARYALLVWGLAVGLGASLLIGVPFVYRGGPLVIVLLSVALASGFAAAINPGSRIGIEGGLLGLAAAYTLIVVALAYGCTPFGHCDRSGYLEMAQPFLVMFGGATACAALFGAVMRGNKRFLALATPAVLILLFSFEFAVSRTYFMPYAYGVLDRPRNAVSHLSKEEVELAGHIRAMGDGVILVSDPFTMANIKALTGLNSVVTFSNLDTQSPSAAEQLRGWLRGVFEGANPAGECAADPLAALAGGRSPELNYWITRTFKPSLSGQEVLALFNYRSSFLLTGSAKLAKGDVAVSATPWAISALENRDRVDTPEADGRLGDTSVKAGDEWLIKKPMILLVINRKTITWAKDATRVNYYPDVRRLDSRLLQELGARCDLRVYGGRFALIRFPMAIP